MGYTIQQSTTTQPLVFLMIDSSDGKTGKTGLTVTVTLSKNGGTFGAASGSVSEIANGLYKVAGNATDNDTLGPLVLHATATGANATDDCFQVVGYAPLSTNLPANVAQWNGTNVASPATAGYPAVTIKSGTGTGELSLSSGQVILQSGTGTGQLDFTSGVVKSNLTQMGGTAQSATDLKDFADTGYDPSTHKVAGVVLTDTCTTTTTTTNLTNAATAGDLTATMKTSVTTACTAATPIAASVSGAVGSVTGNVGGNVTGSVGSLATQAKADVNAEVLDVLNVDTFAEIGQETPAATQTIRKMIAYLYKAFRNKSTQTSTTYSLYNDDASTVGQKATCSDDGATFTRGEATTGP